MLTNKLDFIRYALYGLLIAITVLLYQAWMTDHPPKVIPLTNTSATTETQTTANSDYVPALPDKAATAATNATTAQPAVSPVLPSTQQISIRTDMVEARISPTGGIITEIKLLKYPEELHSKNPVVLLNNDPATRYIAQSDLVSALGPDTNKGQATYKPEQTSYTLENNQNDLQVKLHWENQGLYITKIFTFHRGSYQIDVAYQIDNKTAQLWEGNLFLQLERTNTPPPPSAKSFINLSTYFGAAVSSDDKPFQKIKFSDMQLSPLNETIKGGWAAMIQHYFVSAWVPDANSVSQYFTRVTNSGLYTVGLRGPKITVQPGASAETQAKFYAGPEIADELGKVSTKLPLTIDYGIISLISLAIFWMMQKIHSVVGNWGWSIVIVTMIIKLLFYKLSAKSYRSMSVLKKLQPKITQLKERYGDDKQKLTQATLELYKKERVNPLSGCLPILIQIPVFLGLYWVLLASVELRQAPFILWIHDLSVKDPYYVLPLLMGISMFLQQRLNPPPPDPMQATLMMAMPIVFTVLFLNFPAGLMLYWFVNNTLSFLQQWYIMRTLEDKPLHKNKK